MTKTKKKAVVEFLTIVVECDGKRFEVKKDDMSVTADCTPCDVCGSHDRVSIGFSCPVCKKHHSVEILSS